MGLGIVFAILAVVLAKDADAAVANKVVVRSRLSALRESVSRGEEMSPPICVGTRGEQDEVEERSVEVPAELEPEYRGSVGVIFCTSSVVAITTERSFSALVFICSSTTGTTGLVVGSSSFLSPSDLLAAGDERRAGGLEGLESRSPVFLDFCILKAGNIGINDYRQKDEADQYKTHTRIQTKLTFVDSSELVGHLGCSSQAPKYCAYKQNGQILVESTKSTIMMNTSQTALQLSEDNWMRVLYLSQQIIGHSFNLWCGSCYNHQT